MSEQSSLLMYAIRSPVVLKYVAQLTFVQAGLFLLPTSVALYYAEYALALRFAAVMCLLGAAALPFIRLPAPVQIQTNEALVVTVIAFLMGASAMVYPFMGTDMALLDAVFESVSGITTTGLSTLGELQDKPRSFLIARSWMQWYGGLGFVVLAIALLTGRQPGNRRLLAQEFTQEGMTVSIQQHARQVTLVYSLLTMLTVFLLLLSGVNGFTALAHALSAVSTGGFSTFDNSLSGFSAWHVQLLLSCSAILGAVSLPWYYRIYRQGFSQSLSAWETFALLLLILSVTLPLTLILSSTGKTDYLTSAGQALLLAISAQTTTGFSSLHVDALDPLIKGILLMSMAVGGSVGSTAGGLKVFRFLILLKLMQYTIRHTAVSSHAVFEPKLSGNIIHSEEITNVLTLLGWFLALVFFSWLPFIAMGYHPLDALFEVISATATVGLSTGITRMELQSPLKLILCFDMLAGRLEIIALLVCIYPRTWFGRRMEES